MRVTLGREVSEPGLFLPLLPSSDTHTESKIVGKLFYFLPTPIHTPFPQHRRGSRDPSPREGLAQHRETTATEESKTYSRETCSHQNMYSRAMHTTQGTAIDTEGVCTGQRGAVRPGGQPLGRYSPGLAGNGSCL